MTFKLCVVLDYTPPNILMPTFDRFLHLMIISLYVFSVYTILYVDEKRKDFYVMLTHHFLTISLVATSYTCRYSTQPLYTLGSILIFLYTCYRAQSAGFLVLFVHDVPDMFLDLGKVCNNLKIDTKNRLNRKLEGKNKDKKNPQMKM